MDNIIVGFDLDGVIIDHTQNKMIIASRYGIALRPEDTHSEKMSALFSSEIYHQIQQQIYDDTDEALSAPLMKGAYSVLARLREQHIPFYLISRRKKPIHAIHLLERRELWGEYFTPENVFFVQEPEDKDLVARDLGVTHYIDDESRVLNVMPSVTDRILYDARDLFPETGTYLRVQNWSQIASRLGVANS